MFDVALLDVKQLRRDLLAELRKPQPGWDFRNAQCCAIGMVSRIEGRNMRPEEVAVRLGIPEHADMFTCNFVYGVRHLDEVTPAMVAHRLEELFSRAKIHNPQRALIYRPETGCT